MAAVEKIEDQRKPEDFFGHRNRMQLLTLRPWRKGTESLSAVCRSLTPFGSTPITAPFRQYTDHRPLSVHAILQAATIPQSPCPAAYSLLPPRIRIIPHCGCGRNTPHCETQKRKLKFIRSREKSGFRIRILDSDSDSGFGFWIRILDSDSSRILQ